MWHITDRFANSLRASSQEVINRLDILVDGHLELTIEGRTWIDDQNHEVSLLDGQVDVHRASINRSGQVTISDISDILRPNDAKDMLVPLHAEIRPWRGLLYHDRTPKDGVGDFLDRELVPLGTLVVSSVSSAYPALNISSFDRMYMVKIQSPITKYQISAKTDTVDALATLISSRVPPHRLSFNFPNLNYKVGLTVWDEGSDLAEKAHDLAESIGYMLVVDPMGTFTMVPEPTTDADPVWSYIAGPESMVMPWPTEDISAEAAKNVVVIYGETQGVTPPVLGYAENNVTNSALNVKSLGMKIPDVIAASPIYATKAQADMAAKIKVKKMGMSDIVTLNTVVHPGLASGDTVYAEASHPAGLAYNLLIDDFQIPLRGAGPQTLVARAKVSL